jgi:hypothetical protein
MNPLEVVSDVGIAVFLKKDTLMKNTGIRIYFPHVLFFL